MDIKQIAQRKYGEMMMALTEVEAIIHAKDREIAALKEKVSVLEATAKEAVAKKAVAKKRGANNE